MKLLLDKGAQVCAWDTKRKATPIHCAANKGHLACLKLLISHGADVNAGLTTRSPLHCAVQSSAIDCVRELLENGAIPHSPQIYTETPLHVAASLGSPEIIKLLLSYGAAVNVQCGADKSTPLHLAAEDSAAECARLLLEAGAEVSATNRKLQTPLHLAALSQSAETLNLLLQRGAEPNATDADGRTALHGAIVKVSRSFECVKLLLAAGANVNKPDLFGYTPLHLAALNEFSQCVMLLLNHGGDVTARTNGGVSVLTFITRRTPDVIPQYLSKLDSSIKLTDHEIGDVDCELKLDFRVLVPSIAKGETELLLNFIEVGHREVLKHPLCETFLFLKWRRIRKFFIFSLLYHALFVLLFTVYIIGVFLKDCPPFKRTATVCVVSLYISLTGRCLVCLNVVLLAKELFQIAHSRLLYAKQWENWLQWFIIISVFLCVYPETSMDIRVDVRSWQHHVAAIGIFLTWLELMMLVGRFPTFGLYVQMFTTVAYNFAKFLMAYLCLLIGFGLSFGVLFSNYKSFKSLVWGLLKTLIMMSGELEFEDIFYDEKDKIIYPVTAHIMFLAFVILVTVILTNLMVGLAVSDIQGLQQSAGLDRLVRQAELVAHLESMIFSRLLRCCPRRLLAFLYSHALLLKSRYHWALYIRPNDPREERIPRDIIKNIYQLVAERKDKPRNKRKKSQKVREVDGILRLNSNNSSVVVDSNKNKPSLKMQLEEIYKESQENNRLLLQKIEAIANQLYNSNR